MSFGSVGVNKVLIFMRFECPKAGIEVSHGEVLVGDVSLLTPFVVF